MASNAIETAKQENCSRLFFQYYIEKNIELTQNSDFKERIDFSSFQSGNYKCVLKNDMFSISRTITKKTN